MPFLHHARDMVVRDETWTVLQEEPLKDESLRGDAGCVQNSTRE
jgi:hypothetical protein